MVVGICIQEPSHTILQRLCPVHQPYVYFVAVPVGVALFFGLVALPVRVTALGPAGHDHGAFGMTMECNELKNDEVSNTLQ